LVLKEISQLAEFRRGTVPSTYRKCGKAKCWCASEGVKGHVPQFLWNGTKGGESFSKNLHLGPEVEKYVEETERDHKFIELLEKFVEINEKICNMTPIREVREKRSLRSKQHYCPVLHTNVPSLGRFWGLHGSRLMKNLYKFVAPPVV